MSLSVTTDRGDDTATVKLAGELDLGTKDEVDRAIGGAIELGVRLVVVDLSDLAFIDSSGIAVLLKGRRQADRAGVAYQASAADGIVRQVLSLTGVLEHLSGEAA